MDCCQELFWSCLPGYKTSSILQELWYIWILFDIALCLSFYVIFHSYRSELGACKVSSTERGVNTREVMRAGERMVLVHIINISSEMIGTGRLIHPTKITILITVNLQDRGQPIHYLTTTQFWVLTGNIVGCCRNYSYHHQSSQNWTSVKTMKLL